MLPHSFFSQHNVKQSAFFSSLAKRIGELYIIRHAKCDHNEKGRCAGLYNRSLPTDDGIETTRRMSKILATSETKFNKLYVSPLDRAFNTAKILLKDLPLVQVITTDALLERNFGAFTGMSKNKISELLAHEIFNQYIHDKDFFPPDIAPGHKYYKSEALYGAWPSNHKGESYQCVINRLSPFLEKIKKELLAGQNIVIVGHSHNLQILQMLLHCSTFDQGISQYKIGHVTPIKFTFSLNSNNELVIKERIELTKQLQSKYSANGCFTLIN